MKKFFEKPNFFSFLLFNLLMIWIFLILLFSLSDSVHASSSNPLPYYVDYYQPDYFDFTYSSWETFINDYISNYHTDYDLVWFSEPSEWNSTYDTIDMFFIKTSGGTLSLRNSDLNSDVGYASFDFSSDYVVYSGYVHEERIIYPKIDPSQISINYSVGGFNATYSLLGNRSINSLGYTPNYPYYLKTDSRFLFDGNTVFANGVPSPRGHQLKPPRDSQEDPTYSSGDSAPSVVPYDSNASSDISLIIKTIQYYGNLINHNNNNNFQNLYDNLLPQYYVFSQFYNFGLDQEGNFSLTNAIVNLFEYLFIPDPDDLTDLIESYDDFGIIDFAELSTTYWGNVKTLVTSGDSLFSIRINAFSILGVVCGPYFVDFSWYLPFKPIGDAMISAFLVFGWFVWVYHRLPYWLRGQQGDVSGVITEVNKK